MLEKFLLCQHPTSLSVGQTNHSRAFSEEEEDMSLAKKTLEYCISRKFQDDPPVEVENRVFLECQFPCAFHKSISIFFGTREVVFSFHSPLAIKEKEASPENCRFVLCSYRTASGLPLGYTGGVVDMDCTEENISTVVTYLDFGDWMYDFFTHEGEDYSFQQIEKKVPQKYYEEISTSKHVAISMGDEMYIVFSNHYHAERSFLNHSEEIPYDVIMDSVAVISRDCSRTVKDLNVIGTVNTKIVLVAVLGFLRICMENDYS